MFRQQWHRAHGGEGSGLFRLSDETGGNDSVGENAATADDSIISDIRQTNGRVVICCYPIMIVYTTKQRTEKILARNKGREEIRVYIS